MSHEIRTIKDTAREGRVLVEIHWKMRGVCRGGPVGDSGDPRELV